MRPNEPINPDLILSPGTQVVTCAEAHPIGGGQLCPAGIVGVVVASPSDNRHPYRVRVANGEEIAVRRHEIEILKHFQSEGLRTPADPLAAVDLDACVIYRCIVGSRAYGLDHEASDTDRRGFYLTPAEMHWSLAGAPEQLENHDTQECYWELQKFIVLALKANPNVLECFYTPLVETVTPLAQELLDARAMFLSKLVYQTYNGYVLSQFKKLGQDLRNHGTIKWKHAMHLIRLLLSGITVLRDGFVPVRVDDHRDRLLAIRRGELAWDEVDAWRLALHERFDAAFAATSLPDRPDYEQANAYLVRARQGAAHP